MGWAGLAELIERRFGMIEMLKICVAESMYIPHQSQNWIKINLGAHDRDLDCIQSYQCGKFSGPIDVARYNARKPNFRP